MAITKETMKESLTDKAAVWMEFSSHNSKKFPEKLHCFLEGEDMKYYSDRIERHTGYMIEDIIPYVCTGKKNLLAVWKKISNHKRFDRIKTLFFIDRDYDIENIKYNNQVYKTYYHSLENFYTNEHTIKRILIKEFGIKPIENDFNKVLDIYKEGLKEYRLLISPINAFYISFLKLNKKIDMKKLKIEDFLTISVDGIVVLKEINFDTIKDYYFKKLQSDLKNDKNYAKENIESFNESLDEIETIFNEELERVKNKVQYLTHGKLEFIFLKYFVEDLRKKNNRNLFFEKKRDGVKIDMNSNNILSNLSEHALTTKCLITFLGGFEQEN